MNFWATIEHSLNYKYNGEFPDTLKARLKRAAEASFMLDKEMSDIREEIQEAQHLFVYGKGQQPHSKTKDHHDDKRMSKMRVTVFHNSIPASITAAQKLTKLLKSGHFELDERHPEVVVTIGGDGTLLSAFHRYADQLNSIRFIGVHTGHLGFYTDWRDFEIEDLVIALKKTLDKALATHFWMFRRLMLTRPVLII